MNKKNEKTAWIILGIIIIALVVLPNLKLEKFAIGEDSLIYKIHDSGTCNIAVETLQGNKISYPLTVSVTTATDSTGGMSVYAKFDSLGSLPPPAGYSNYGDNYCYNYGLTKDPDYWDVVYSGSKEILVDYCPTGAHDPKPDDGIVSYQCYQYCTPDSTACLSDGFTLATCSADGKRIEHTNCTSGCNANVQPNRCAQPERQVIIQTDQDVYSLGENINGVATFNDSNGGIQGASIDVQLLNNVGGLLGESSNQSDSNGQYSFTFIKPASGEVIVKVIATYSNNTIYGPTTKMLEILGNSVKYEVATYSPTQYSSKNITFTVHMQDADKQDILPQEITNLRVVATLTQGTVYSSEVNHTGNGVYEIKSKVDGSGQYVGKISFKFQGVQQSSPIETIDVRPMGISIDVSQIAPGATLYSNMTYTIKTFDSSGTVLDPDNINIKVSLPDGTTVKEIPMSEITKVSPGVYKFSFNFTEVEKHSFNIYADYQNYAKGSSLASVAVSSSLDTGPGIGGFTNYTWIIYVLVGALIIFLIVKFAKKKK